MHPALSQYEELFFYVDNALMIISWKLIFEANKSENREINHEFFFTTAKTIANF